MFIFSQDCLQEVDIHPKTSGHSMLSQLQTRTYWCISRQRVWGLPIPVFYHKQTNQPLVNRLVIFSHDYNPKCY